MKTLLTAILSTVFISGLFAQGYKVGASVADFSLTNAVDGKKISLSSYSDAKAVVIIFTSNYCPYSKLYEQRIKELANEYKDKKVEIVLINPNNPAVSENETPEEMKVKAEENNYPYPYLADPDQKVCNLFGAVKTPEVFVLKTVQNGFRLYYKGALDDSPQSSTDVRERYLEAAVKSIILGTPLRISEKRATGCIIKKN